MTRTYYTLEDLVVAKEGQWPIEFEIAANHVVVGSSFLLKLAGRFLPEGTVIAAESPLRTDEANSLFCKYIAPLYKDSFIGFSDIGGDAAEAKVYADFFRKFSALLNNNADKYIKMISVYEAEKNNLMDDVTSYTESKFNDTPQANNAGLYDWTDDNHLTNVSRNTTSSQVATKMARIDELDRLITNYYKKWLNDFKPLFFYGGI